VPKEPYNVNSARADLARITFAVLFIGALTLASFWILRPFLAAFVWAVMVVVATWPVLIKLEALLGGRRSLAVLCMSAGMFLLFFVPIVLAVDAIVEHTDTASAWLKSLESKQVRPPPDWLAGVPLIGKQSAEAWSRIAGTELPELAARVQPYARSITRWVVTEAGELGLLILEILLIVVLSAVLYAGGEDWARWLKAFAQRLAAERGEAAVTLAGQAIRGVALGVIVTAIVQSVLAGLGLAVAGVPFAAPLTAVILLLCIAQLGPVMFLILMAAAGWLYNSGATGWAIGLVIWAIFVGTMDNFLRPVLIRSGVDLPFILIFGGVIGGLLSFGPIGLFVGPVLLAVAYTLLDAWVMERSQESA
jgi:predicted PurR-regulated permease PerM